MALDRKWDGEGSVSGKDVRCRKTEEIENEGN